MTIRLTISLHHLTGEFLITGSSQIPARTDIFSMAEPLTILSIAAATAQFIDFGLKTLALCKQIRDSTTDQVQLHTELQADIKRLGDIRKGVTLDNCPRELKDTTRDCSSVAKELEDLLLEIQGIAKTKRLGALRAALRALKDQRKIEKLQTKLEKCQHKFHAAISVDTREKVLQQLKEQGTLNQNIEQILLPEVRRMHQESSKAHATTHSKLTFLESGQQTSKDAILESQKSIRNDFLKAYGDTFSKLTVLEDSQRASSDAAKHGQGKIRQEMHGRFNDAEASGLHESFMESLKYPDMFARYQSIRAPSPTTYEWIFAQDDPKGRGARGSFRRWLESEGLVFWINGKAGSGKSSLMSFIEDDHRTQQALKTWTGNRPLHTISAFFWRAGSALQKSFVGMLQSLLHQLCQKKPAVVESITTNDPSTRYHNAWNETKLLRALGWALACYQDECIFCMIDGLDEHEGQYTKLLDALFRLQHVSGMKLCVSSRPEPAIYNRLNAHPSLRLQDLNYGDIKTFVENEFAGRGVSFGSELVHKVAGRAEGIFLWAVLACRSLVSGHDAKDDEATLQLRLEAIPAGLRELFRRMFSDLDANYRSHLSVYFCLLKWASNAHKSISVALVTVIMHQSPFGSLKDFRGACRIWQDRIVAQCNGLIEVDMYQRDEHDLEWALRDLQTGNVRRQPLEEDRSPATHDFTTSYLRWIHRSAYDCVLGDSKDGPIPCFDDVDVDGRALTDKALAAHLWIVQYAPMYFDFDKAYADAFVELAERLHYLQALASMAPSDMHESVRFKSTYPMLDDLYNTICASFFEDVESNNMILPLKAPIHKQGSQQSHDPFRSVSPLNTFWSSIAYGCDDYVDSRFERIKGNAYTFSVCADLLIEPARIQSRVKAMSVLQQRPKGSKHFAMVATNYHRTELVAWLGNDGEHGDAAVWGIFQAFSCRTVEPPDERLDLVDWTVIEAWELYTGKVMICDQRNSSEASPLQLTLPMSRLVRTCSVIRMFIIDFAEVFHFDQSDVPTLLATHESSRILSCFDLSARSTRILLAHSHSKQEVLRFSGTFTEYTQCLRAITMEVWKDTAQLDAGARLRLVGVLIEWFVKFWKISDPSGSGASCENDSDDEERLHSDESAFGDSGNERIDDETELEETTNHTRVD